jgi:hypothetical protein
MERSSGSSKLRSEGRRNPAVLLILFACVISLAISVAFGAGENVSLIAQEKARENRAQLLDVIVTFKEPPGLIEKEHAKRLGASVDRQFRSIPGLSMRIPAAAVKALSHQRNVAWITLDVPVFDASAKEVPRGFGEILSYAEDPFEDDVEELAPPMRDPELEKELKEIEREKDDDYHQYLEEAELPDVATFAGSIVTVAVLDSGFRLPY